MPSTAQLKLIEELLHLPNLKVTDYTNEENLALIIQVAGTPPLNGGACGDRIPRF